MDASPARPPSGAARVSAVLFGALAGFQLALALGAPWGRAAWGGGQVGALPAGLRVASGVAALAWAAVAVLVGTGRLSGARRRRLLSVLMALSVVSLALNLASRSGVERAIWAPFALVQVALLGKARHDESR